jgi:hypothetical protein
MIHDRGGMCLTVAERQRFSLMISLPASTILYSIGTQVIYLKGSAKRRNPKGSKGEERECKQGNCILVLV